MAAHSSHGDPPGARSPTGLCPDRLIFEPARPTSTRWDVADEGPRRSKDTVRTQYVLPAIAVLHPESQEPFCAAKCNEYSAAALRASSCALREDAALRAARFGRAPRCAHAECVVIVTRGALDVGSNGWRPLQ